MSVIPQVRAEMLRVADGPDLSADEYRALLRAWVPRLQRRKSEYRATKVPRRTKAQIRHHQKLIKSIAAANPEMGYQQISLIAGGNIGRVSECLRGFADQ